MKQLDIGVVREILQSMPDVQESTIHGYPSFKTQGKLLACAAIHKSVEPNSLVVKIPFDERNELLVEHPRKYYMTDHYVRNSVVLVRLSEFDRKSLRSFLERALLLLKQSRRSVRSTKPVLALQPASKKSPKKPFNPVARKTRSGLTQR
jgi:hypothetical protein